MKKKTARNRLLLKLLLLLLAALPYRLYHYNWPILDSFNFRQAQTATIAKNFYFNGINLFRTELDIFGIGPEKYLTLEFPLYQAMLALFYQLFGFNEVWGRIISIAAGFGGAFFLYLLVNLIVTNRKIALYSAFFFLFVPLNLFYHRSLMIDPLVIFLLLAGTYYMCLFAQSRNLVHYFLGLIFMILGFIHKGLYGPFYLLPIAGYFLKVAQKKKSLNYLWYLILLTVPLIFLILWQSHVNSINTQSNKIFFTSYNPGHLEWNFGQFKDRVSLSQWSFRLKQILNGILLKPGLFLLPVGLVFLWHKDKSRFFVLFLLSQIIYFLVLFRINQQNYYQLIMVPAFAVILASGLFYSESFVRRFGLSRLFVFAFTVLFIFKSWINTLPSFYIDWDWYKRWKQLDNILPPNALGILVTPGYDWNSVYTYLSGRKMNAISLENLNEGKVIKMIGEGYNFLILRDYQNFDDYIKVNNLNISLDYLKNYQLLSTNQEFMLYIL